MEATYPAKAIILKREPRGDNDSRVVVYTRERGRLDLVARGTKKLKSKLAAHVEPLCITDVMVVTGRRYDYIGAARSENCLGGLKTDWDKLIAAGRAAGIFGSLVKENLREEALFELLEDYLKTVNAREVAAEKAEPLTDFFVLKLLSILGHRPELDNCVNCRKRISPGRNGFDFSRGGVMCATCYDKLKGGRGRLTVSDNCIKILRLAVTENFDNLKVISINEKLKKEINEIIGTFKNYLL